MKKRLVQFTLLGGLTLMLAGCVLTSRHQMTWEYKVVQVAQRGAEVNEVEKELNYQATQGWVFVSDSLSGSESQIHTLVLTRMVPAKP